MLTRGDPSGGIKLKFEGDWESYVTRGSSSSLADGMCSAFLSSLDLTGI
jgi:hypothetical protein